MTKRLLAETLDHDTEHAESNTLNLIVGVKLFNLNIHHLSAASCVKILIMSKCDNLDVKFLLMLLWPVSKDLLHKPKDLFSHNAPHMSRVMRKPDFCLCKNKSADQLCSNCTADQRLCLRYTDSTIPRTIPLLSKSKISSFSHLL